jgi:hypothetical protein
MTTPETEAVAAAFAYLRDAHDALVAQLGGDAYVSVTATWRPSEDAPLTTLSYSTIDTDDEDEDEDEDDDA